VDPDESISLGDPKWKQSYLEQRRSKLEQLTQIVRYAEFPACRMLRLVQHFGDQEDSGEPCGQCDVCAPDACLIQRDRPAGEKESRDLQQILLSLRARNGQAAGRLYREQFERVTERRSFEALVEGLVRAGFVALREDSFAKDGKVIEYRRLFLTAEGRRAAESKEPLAVRVRFQEQPSAARKRARKRGKPRAKTAARLPATEAPAALAAELKSWRLTEARRRSIPAFRILTDRVLNAIAATRPSSEDELLAISGFGPRLFSQYGAKILAILRESS
jgi:DNA topoisomerase-3